MTDDDLLAIVTKLVEIAKSGDLPAARKILDGMLCNPKSTLEVERTSIEEARLDQELEHVLQDLAARSEATDFATGVRETASLAGA